jgi:spermidine/putrescine transport system substrate-binding protein
MNVKADVDDYRDLPEAESYIHQGWSGDFVSVQYYYPGWSPRDVIRYWYPQNHKGEIGGDLLTVLQGGKNPVLAHQFLNFMLDFDNAMVNFKWNGYMPPMKKITNPDQLLRNSKDPLMNPAGTESYNVIPPSLGTAVTLQTDFDNGYQALELLPAVDDKYKSVWEAFQTA